jgi:tetratricopeptide (TPR) repeat protein
MNSKYKEAISLMETGQTQQAIDAFTALKNYRDSEVYAVECQNRLTYEQAEALKADGRYAEASSMFASLGNFEDAAEQSEECRNAGAYELAISLKDANELEQAYEALRSWEPSGTQKPSQRNAGRKWITMRPTRSWMRNNISRR